MPIQHAIWKVGAATNQSVLGIRETATIKHCFIYPFIMGEIPRYMILRTGAQQPHINKGTVDETPLVIPPPKPSKPTPPSPPRSSNKSRTSSNKTKNLPPSATGCFPCS